jgi:hypothetical protein
MKSSITTLTLSISVLCFVLLSSCSEEHSSEPSEARVNAIALHDDSGRLAKEFHVKLANEFAVTEITDSSFIKLLEQLVITRKENIITTIMQLKHNLKICLTRSF